MSPRADRRGFLSNLFNGVLGGSLILSANGVVAKAAAPFQSTGPDPRPGSGTGTWVKADAAADMVFLSGAAALDLYHRHPHQPRDEILPDDSVAQTHMTLRNLDEVLRIAGLSWNHVVHALIYVRAMADYPAILAVLRRYFGDWHPALSAVEIRRLSAPNSLLEIELMAIAPPSHPAAKADPKRNGKMNDIDVIHSRPALADSMIFAPGIRIDAGTDMIFLSGITAAPLDQDEARSPLPDDFDMQVRMATQNIDHILAGIGADKSRIIRIVSFYTEDFSGREMGRYLEGWRPCSSAIGVNALPMKGAKIMFDLIIAAP
ncbi:MULTISPECIES: RidA family protein [unclassified Iodidimonas]|jgi:enamine deaminase RidA (YjgF/YER057c/UK114 family)|uniref:RidA family protein n=1 Tax=unclassified Iodidimonas TaxID=2626145 RepID=UPI002482367F|nr:MULTISPECIES: RidA family protein [unclassified Iodidimonas]